MKTNLTTALSNNTSLHLNNVSLAEAKTWVGRLFLLRKEWLGFDAGTRCRVMCVVDFGDGLLLWITTDDKHALEVDQVEFSVLDDLFIPLSTEAQSCRLVPSEISVV